MATNTKKMMSYEKSKKDKETKGTKEMSKADKAMDKKGMMSGMKGKKKC
jgi:hypothetical protein